MHCPSWTCLWRLPCRPLYFQEGLLYTLLMLIISLAFFLPTLVYAQKYSFATTYSAHLDHTHTEVIAKSIAYTRTIHRASIHLAQRKSVKFSLQDPNLRKALAAALYDYKLHIKSEPQALTRGNMYLTLELVLPDTNTQSHINALLTDQVVLLAYLEFIELLEKYTQEGKIILQKSEEKREDGVVVGRILEALWLYYEALKYFQDTWQQPQKVHSLLTEALKIHRQLPCIVAALGEVELQMNHPLKALDHLNNALSMQKNRPRALYIRGLAHLRLQHLALAKQDISDALQQSPHMPSWYRARAAVHLALRDTPNMCLDLEQACSLGECQDLYSVRQGGLCLPTSTPQ